MTDMGGGATTAAITADLIARAVIAAARTYGDDPVRALTVPSGKFRRCVAPAVMGLHAATGIGLPRAARLLGASAGAVAASARLDRDGFGASARAAEDAVRYAVTWYPQARASVVATAPVPVDEAIPPGPRRSKPGPISSWGTTAEFIPPPRTTPETPLRDRILGALAGGSACTQGLATILDVKELLVGQSLSAMQGEGLVEPGDMPPEGRRQQRWRLRETVTVHG